MIKFYRKVRQHLLMENKTGKYFKYAFGEILLVVIGILIALQINNWNENRKSNIAELETFQRIINDLKTEYSKAERYLDYFNRHKALLFQIYNETQGKAIYDASIDYPLLRSNQPYVFIITKNYSEASNNINNLNVKEQLEAYFRNETFVEDGFNNIYSFKIEHLRPSFSRHGIHNTKAMFENPSIDYIEMTDRDIIDYSKMKAQYGTVEFDQLLFELENKILWTIYTLMELQEENEKLRLLLENELNKRN